MFELDDYRIWDKKEERWCTDEYIVYFAYDCDCPFGLYSIVSEDKDGNRHRFGDEEEKDRFVFELCSSLKDINGERIHEGDIVEGVHPFPQNWSVVCNNRAAKKHMCHADLMMYPAKFWHEGSVGSVPILSYMFVDEERVKVKIIGNIHDNPEKICENPAIVRMSKMILEQPDTTEWENPVMAEMSKEDDIRLWDKVLEAVSKLPEKEGAIDITNYEELIPALIRQAINDKKQEMKNE